MSFGFCHCPAPSILNTHLCLVLIFTNLNLLGYISYILLSYLIVIFHIVIIFCFHIFRILYFAFHLFSNSHTLSLTKYVYMDVRVRGILSSALCLNDCELPISAGPKSPLFNSPTTTHIPCTIDVIRNVNTEHVLLIQERIIFCTAGTDKCLDGPHVKEHRCTSSSSNINRSAKAKALNLSCVHTVQARVIFGVSAR